MAKTAKKSVKKTRKPAKSKRPVRASKRRLNVISLAERLGAAEPVEKALDQTEAVVLEIREQVSDRVKRVAENAQIAKLTEQLSELENRAEEELDAVLERLGLMRTSTHEILVEKARKSAVRSERRRVKKALAKE